MVNNAVWYSKKVDKTTREIEALINKRNYYIMKMEEMRINHLSYCKTRRNRCD